MRIGIPIFMLSVLLIWSTSLIQVHGYRQVPYYFNFGDSMTSNGNNNKYLFTIAKVNFRPYGIDFRGGIPTGRCSNGRNYVDVLCELLGLEDYIPPFSIRNAQPEGVGINYASAASGILHNTGATYGKVLWFDGQIRNHEITVAKLRLFGNSSTEDMLKRSLYTIGIGNNDYLNAYIRNSSLMWKIFTPTTYADYLIAIYRKEIQKLYKLGARKVALNSLLLAGCTPFIINISPPLPKGSLCVESFNHIIQIFNRRLRFLVDELNRKYKNAKFIYINSANIQRSITKGFRVKNKSCCTTFLSTGICVPLSRPCSNRNDYLFWDGFHPTERVHIIAAHRAYKARDPDDAYPMDISRLVSLRL